jgi:hypothetical protein
MIVLAEGNDVTLYFYSEARLFCTLGPIWFRRPSVVDETTVYSHSYSELFAPYVAVHGSKLLCSTRKLLTCVLLHDV